MKIGSCNRAAISAGALLATSGLSGCAAVALATADLIPRAPGIDGYSETVDGVEVKVDNWFRRSCKAMPSPFQNRPGPLLCARVDFPPQSGLNPTDKVKSVNTVIARNQHMAPTGVSDAALIAANAEYLSKPSYPNVREGFIFPYFALTDERTVFARD